MLSTRVFMASPRARLPSPASAASCPISNWRRPDPVTARLSNLCRQGYLLHPGDQGSGLVSKREGLPSRPLKLRLGLALVAPAVEPEKLETLTPVPDFCGDVRDPPWECEGEGGGAKWEGPEEGGVGPGSHGDAVLQAFPRPPRGPSWSFYLRGLRTPKGSCQAAERPLLPSPARAWGPPESSGSRTPRRPSSSGEADPARVGASPLLPRPSPQCSRGAPGQGERC